MENYEMRAQAREALRGQWGTNAAIVFFSGLISNVLAMAITSITSFDTSSYASVITTFLIGIFITFAFTYAQYYVALEVIRGDRAEIGDIFAIFSGKYYVPMLVFNLISTFLQFILGLIIYVPMLLIFGFGAYFTFAFGGTSSITGLFGSLSAFSSAFYIVVTIVTVALFLLLTFIMDGVFKFAAWAKIENPDLPTLKAVSYAWFLIKDRLWKYILMNLSYIGWWLTCIFILPIFWVVPYYNTGLAAFYANAQNEKGIPEIV